MIASGPAARAARVRFSEILLDEPRPNSPLPDMRNIGKNAQHHDTEVMTGISSCPIPVAVVPIMLLTGVPSCKRGERVTANNARL